MFDSLTIAAVADELNRRACPAKIQRVLTLGPLALGLELYTQGQRQQLIISAHADNARVHLSNHTLTRDPAMNDTPLLLLLRKYVRGGRLLSVAQPDLERVLLLSISKILPTGKSDESNYTQLVNHTDNNDEDAEEIANGEEIMVRLVVEMMGRHSNIILVDSAGTIMESLKRVPASVNRYRVILPHQPYVAPPAQDKLRFSGLTPDNFRLAVERAATPTEGKKKAVGQLWQGLVGALQGMSPQMAKEIVYRATTNTDALASGFSDWSRLHDQTAALFDLTETGDWQSCVVYDQAAQTSSPQEEVELAPSTKRPLPVSPSEGRFEIERAIAFASYRLHHLEGENHRLLATASISEAVEAYFSSMEQTAAHEQLKEQLRGRVAQRRTKIASRLHSLREQLARAAEVDTLRYKGEMIFAYQYAIEPGMNSLSVPAPNAEGEISIALDPELTVAENAQRYFRDYHKSQAAGAELPERIAAAEQEIAYLDEMSEMIAEAQGYEDISLTARELADLDKPPAPPKPGKQKQKAKPGLPPGLGKLLRLTSPDGMEVYVGKSMRQNEYLAFKVAAPDDIWMHARGVPGAHIVVKMQGIPHLPQRTLLYAAGLAAGRSQARHNTAAEVLYTYARYLRKPPGAPPGTVLYSHEQSIRVAPILPAEK